MSESVESQTMDSTLRKSIILWAAIGVLLIAALVVTIASLNRDVYGPRGLVSAYLNDLAHHESQAALALPGVDLSRSELRTAGVPASTSRELLRTSVLGELGGIRIVSADDLGQGMNRVTASYLLDGIRHESVFTLKRTGSYLGVFARWRFAASPLAVAQITIEHAQTFTLAGNTLNPRATREKQGSDFSAAADYLLFAPAHYRFAHSSPMLTATPIDVILPAGATQVRITVDAKATDEFIDLVQKKLDAFLKECTKQQVLQPSGCPFGTDINDRVQGTPTWSMKDYPTVTMVPGANGWRMPSTGGVAHITVKVQSLFDGSVSTLSRDVPFAASLRIALAADGTANITVGG